MRAFAIAAVVVALSSAPSVRAGEPRKKTWRVESLPNTYVQRAAKLDERHFSREERRSRFGPLFVIPDRDKRWDNKTTVRVAFRGGSEDLRKNIEQAANEWTTELGVKFTFRDKKGEFLTWSPGNFRYEGDIRISFDTPSDPGYWSIIGRDAADKKVCGPGEASMNFQNFDVTLPSNYKATVLHEFGHALGFDHEHQNPNADCVNEFRWDDDEGYTEKFDGDGFLTRDDQGRYPGVYHYLESEPYNWDKPKIDRAMGPMRRTDRTDAGTFDRASIMLYNLEPWLYRRGVNSPCYAPESGALSSEDRKGMKGAYPP